MDEGPPRTTHILLVEDDALDVMSVRRALTRARLSNPVRVVGDGMEALDVLRHETVPGGRRLVLLDLNMPRMGGLEFLRELRADPKLHATPVVVLTTSNDERDKAAAFDHHVAGYLLKPLGFTVLVDLLESLNRYWSHVEMP